MAILFEIRGRPAVKFDIGSVKVINGGGGGTPYDGDYVVTPKINEAVVLETKQKTMRDNVTVKKIPQYEVSNPFGGYTLIMGDEYMQGG